MAISKSKWNKDELGDYNIEVTPKYRGALTTRGKIIRCPVTTSHRQYHWTKNRWLLLVSDHPYGFYETLRQAMERFDKDCMPADNPSDDGGETYCWHEIPYGPGPYCTGCGGLVKK